MKFRTQFNEDYKGAPGSEQSPESQTVPDMGLTLRELLINHTRGLPSGITFNEGHYFDSEIPIIEDLTDLQDRRRELEMEEKRLTSLQSDDLNQGEPSIPIKEDHAPEPSVAKE